jgi:hypothetical protein
VLEEASREGEVQIRRQDGRVYAVTPVAKPAQSPFANVTGQPAKGVTSKDLLRAVRDEVGTWGAHASERPSGSRTLHSAGAFGPCRRCDGPGQLSACTQCARLSCEGIMKHTRCGWRAFVVLLAVDLSACAGPNAARGQTVVRDNVDRYVEGEMRQRGILACAPARSSSWLGTAPRHLTKTCLLRHGRSSPSHPWTNNSRHWPSCCWSKSRRCR